MVKKHVEVSLWTPTNYDIEIDKLIAEETAERMNKMFANVKIRMTHVETGVNCEFDLGAESNVTDTKSAIKHLVDNGFVRTSSATTGSKADNAGKTGKVTSVEKVEGKNQWKVIVTLDEVGAGQQQLITFAATAFRKGDRVRLSRNEKGYYDGVVINDEGPDGEKQVDITL